MRCAGVGVQVLARRISDTLSSAQGHLSVCVPRSLSLSSSVRPFALELESGISIHTLSKGGSVVGP